MVDHRHHDFSCFLTNSDSDGQCSALENHEVSNSSQRGGTLENSGEMLGWELRELRELKLRVTKDDQISKSSQMRNKTTDKDSEQKRRTNCKNNTDLAR